MNKFNIIDITKNMFDENINLHLQTVPGKWYEQKFTSDFTEIEQNKVYGVSFDGSILFDFKTGVNEDMFLKSFINQFTTKWLMKNPFLPKGTTKNEVLEKYKNSERVDKWLFYTTLYGIGCFSLFLGSNALGNIEKQMSEYLKSKNIDYYNEFSDARWVYRFCIKKDVETHNELLRNFNPNI